MTESYSKGLAGVIADESALCLVDGAQGQLFYRGYPIDALCKQRSFEEVAYLLLYGAFPDASQLSTFQTQLAANYQLPEFAQNLIRSMPPEKHPMEVLMAVVPVLGTSRPAEIETERFVEGEEKRTRVVNAEGVRDELVAILARIPTIIAYFERHRAGQPLVPPDSQLSYLENFLAMFHGEAPSARDVEIFAICEILQMEHGFNASTFTARVVASTLAPLHTSIAAAIGALYGKLHGGADEAAFRMARDEIGGAEKAEAYVDELLAQRGKIMGLGHRVYQAMDPRAKILKSLAAELNAAKGGEKQMVFQTLTRVEEVMADRMAKKGKEIHPNVEFFKGPVFHALDIPTDQFTAMFVIARAFGWGAHILELWEDHRIYRPRAKYVGPRHDG